MKHSVLLPALAAAVLGSGCIAIPMGTETFTTEYPTDVQPSDDPPTKKYTLAPVVADNEDSRLTVDIGLTGEIEICQPQTQRYESVTVEKRKMLAFGLLPHGAPLNIRPSNALCVMQHPYVGNGEYAFGGGQKLDDGDGMMGVGNALNLVSLTVFPTVYSLLVEPFAPYEKKQHFLGRQVSFNNRSNVHTTLHSQRDIELLLKFPMSEREKIGAWTFHENKEHPQNNFQLGFFQPLVGFYKYCNYIVQDPVPSDRTSQAKAAQSTIKRSVSGPYSVSLTLPSLGFSEMVNVDPGWTTATFRLSNIANGDSFANGTVRFLPPSGGLAAVRDEDDRAILELAMEREWPVTVALPAPRIGKVAKPEEGGTARPAGAPYQIASIGRTADGDGLVVRVTVNDTAKTFEIDRAVRPEVQRMFREQFATGENAGRRESVAMKTEDGGKTLVYTVSFE